VNVSDTLQQTMKTLDTIYKGLGIVLIIADPDGTPNKRSNYISNCPRADMIVFLKETIARLEGRVQETETQQ